MNSIPYPPGVSAPRSRIAPWQRHKRSHPCRICEDYDEKRHGAERCWGFISEDEEYELCTRPDFAGALHPVTIAGRDHYRHRLRGDCWCGNGPHDGPATSTPPRGQRQDRQPEQDAQPKRGPFPKVWPGLPGMELRQEYIYRDADGIRRYAVLRYETTLNPHGAKPQKEIRQAHWLDNDTWLPNLAGVERLLYRLPELLATPDCLTVFIVEGEKAVEALRALGFIATCNSEGAGKWDKAPGRYEALRGRHVVILPDNDTAGREHAAAVAADLRGVAASVRVLMLPGLPEKGDVVEWLDAGGGIHDLYGLVVATDVASAPAADGESGAESMASDVPTPNKLIIIEAKAYRELRARRDWERRLDANPNVPVADKTAIKAIRQEYEMAGLADRTQWVRVDRAYTGKRIGTSRDTAGNYIKKAADMGAFERRLVWDKTADGQPMQHIELRPTAMLLEHPERLGADKPNHGWGGKRERQCTACGSTNLETRTVCRDCGEVLDRHDVNVPAEPPKQPNNTPPALETCPSGQDDVTGNDGRGDAYETPQADVLTSYTDDTEASWGTWVSEGEPIPILALHREPLCRHPDHTSHWRTLADGRDLCTACHPPATATG